PGRKNYDQDRSARSFAEPDGDAHHQRERGESGKPSEPDVRFPGADVKRQSELRGTEVPEIVVHEPSGSAGFTEDGIDRRQALPRHRIDDCDFRMIENRIGKIYASR